MTAAQAPAADGGPADALDSVFQAVRAGDVGLAKRLALQVLASGRQHPVLLNLRALDHEDHGRFEEALADLQRAHVLAPGDFTILNGCGLAFGRLGRPAEAAGCFKRAIAMESRFAPAHFNLGWAYEQLGELALAEEAYRASVELTPQNVQAWANLAWLGARRGDPEAAKRSAERALQLQDANPTALLALAAAGVDEPPLIETKLRQLLARELSRYDRGLAFSLLGDALDAQDRCAEAFAAYASSNAEFQAEYAPRFGAQGQPTVAGALSWLRPWATGLKPQTWVSEGAAGSGGERQHVFLMGFARSGTTLIESALAAHPDVVSLEERNTLQAGVKAFMGDASGLAKLERMTERELEPYREDYWSFVRSCGVEPKGKLFIDKNPFNTLKLPLIAKLFPRAKIVFAIRDPRDVVLSCFRRRFNINASTYDLLDLGRAAMFYVGNMQFAEMFRSKVRLDWRELMFERLIADFAGETRDLCDFLGLEWRPEMIDFANRARRGGVASASSAQIARGLNTDGAGQWRRYKAELEPVRAVLRPWAERYGYPAD
jgi:Flp pilus assembly protein TadD